MKALLEIELFSMVVETLVIVSNFRERLPFEIYFCVGKIQTILRHLVSRCGKLWLYVVQSVFYISTVAVFVS